MSSKDIALSVRGLSKAYSIAHNATRHTTIAEALVHTLKKPFTRVERETFWALKDVSFDVRKGDVVGIIGRNGAGKSTLLKILSRITEPTTGEIDLYGRVGSLLEVGTGFHPELTGRENIYLNGAILGMKRREIARQFDAIVDFAEVANFLDTPVKRYSSGMYVRLAFAVAAHLNPEILIVDEVLAVGDIAFQKKCLGKMEDVAKTGRTVLFVSHNLTALSSLCRRGILLDGGAVLEDTDIASSISCYIGHLLDMNTRVDLATKQHGFHHVSLRDLDDPCSQNVQTIHVPGRYAIEFACRLPDTPDVNIGFTLFNGSEIPVASSCIRDSLQEVPAGDVRLRVEIPGARLPSGNYRVEGAVWDGSKQYDQSDALLVFSVVNTHSTTDAVGGKPRGATLLESPWRCELSNPVI